MCQKEQALSKWHCIRDITKSFLVCKLTKSCFLYKNFSLVLAFCKIEFTMFSSVRVGSKIVPRYLTLSLSSITLPLHSIFKFDCDLSLGLEPNKIDSVLPKCNDNLISGRNGSVRNDSDFRRQDNNMFYPLHNPFKANALIDRRCISQTCFAALAIAESRPCI